MNRYLITYETEFRGRWHTLTEEISAPGYAQARVAFQVRRANDFSLRIKSVEEIDQHSW